jgi:hypothetical protein
MDVEREVISIKPGSWIGTLICKGRTFEVEVTRELIEGELRWRLDLMEDVLPFVEGTDYPSLDDALAAAQRLVQEL